MPVSKRGRKSKAQTAAKKAEMKRINRLRGNIANSNMSTAEARAYIKALKDKRTPYELLVGTHKDIIDSIANFDLITLTASRFEEHPEFKDSFSKSKPDLFKQVVDSNALLTELKQNADKVLEDNTAAFKALGNRPTQEEWIATLPALDGYDAAQQGVVENAEALLDCVGGIIEFTQEVSAYAEVNIKGK